MLILTRKVGESIVIGNEIVVTVVEVRGEQVRIGIDAPRDVQVHREEIFRQIEAQNTQAATSAGAARRLVARMPHNADRSSTAAGSSDGRSSAAIDAASTRRGVSRRPAEPGTNDEARSTDPGSGATP